MDALFPFLARFALFAGIALIGAACADPSASPEDGETDARAAGASQAQNELTDAERDEGWILLFDGEDLSTHWRGFQREDVPSAWRVEEETIFFDPSAEDGGDIVTREQFGSFELVLDWRISEGGNSGIFFRVSEEADATWHTGPEYQLLDNDEHPDAENGTDRWAAANYALHPPSPQDVTRPVGEWNRARIVVDGNHVEHWLNGQQVVEYELGSEDWQEQVASSKFDDYPGYGQYEEGHIGLQDHGDAVWFRNIKIRPLE